jgi:hypothetical protein
MNFNGILFGKKLHKEIKQYYDSLRQAREEGIKYRSDELLLEESTQYVLKKYKEYHELSLRFQEFVGNTKAPPRTKLRSPLIWITIRPTKLTIKEFQFRVIEWLRDTKNILEWEYCFEQKGETPETCGQGHHLHGLFSCKYTAAKVKQDILSYFKNFGMNGYGVDAEKIRFEDDAVRLRNYMTGDKHNCNKQFAVHFDEPWRKSNNLKNLYEGS